MVTSMKSNHDAECPLEQFLQGKWLVDCRFPLIPASELLQHGPKKRTRVTVDWDEEDEILEKNHKMEKEEEEKERPVDSKKNARVPKVIIKYQEKHAAESLRVRGEDNKHTGNKGSEANPTLVLKLTKESKENTKGRPKVLKRKSIDQEEISPKKTSGSSSSSSESLGHTIKRGKPRKSTKSDEDGGESTVSESLDRTVKQKGRPRKSSKDNEERGETIAFETVYDCVKRRGRARKSTKSEEDGRESTASESLDHTVKKRGRPRKNTKSEEDGEETTASESLDHTVKKRGRPRKNTKSEEDGEETTASESLDHTVKKRGRPRKNTKSEEDGEETTASESLDHTVKKRGRPKKNTKSEEDGEETTASESQDLIPNGRERPKGVREDGGEITSSDSVEPYVKRRGRPKKKEDNKARTTSESPEAPIKRKGRPKKTTEKGDNNKETTSKPKKRGPGRPCKIPQQAPRTENPSAQEPQTVAYSHSGRPISGNRMVQLDESEQVSSEDESWIDYKEKIKTKKQAKVKAKTKEEGKETKEVKKRGRKRKDEVNAGKEKKENEEEVLKPEDCIVTAKRGTLKYLHQREKYVKALANEVQIDDDFFASKAPVKKNMLENLLFSASPDDSLTIKTPQGKGKKVSSNIITPRTMKLGQWASESPWSEPITPSTGTSPLHPTDKKEALDVIYQHMKGRKRWPQPIRKVLSESSSQSMLDSTSTMRKLEPLELPTLPEIPEEKDGESSDDDYFNSSEVN
nr:DNA ligase 1-like [Penaeus vannamei]